MPRLLANLGFLVVCIASTGAAPASERSPVHALVRVAPFRIESQPLPGMPRPGNGSEGLLSRLAEEAISRAERTLLKQRLAERVERIADIRDAGGAPVLSGCVSMPLGPKSTVRYGRFREGTFARATVVLRMPDGSSTQRTVTLDWQSVRWTRGPRYRPERPRTDVLVDFTRKAVDHAVKSLALPPSNPSPVHCPSQDRGL